MSNSSLVNYTKISPNKTPNRNHKIDTITIHCVVGQTSVERLGDIFAPTSRGASSNYGVGYDGKIGLYCDEKDRSWCSGGRDKNGNPIKVNGISGSDNDHRAITIEVASDSTHPYKITDAAYKGLINLLVDICKRNNIPELKWHADKSLVGQVDKQNMTVHRWFANKSCPGDYLYNLHGQIADEVNAKLGKKTNYAKATTATTQTATSYNIKVGDEVKITTEATYYNGKAIPAWVTAKNWIVAEIKGDRAVVNKSADGKHAINSAINAKYLTVVTNTATTPAVDKNKEINDIVWELANRGIITDKTLWLKKLAEDSNSYWLAKKTIAYFKTKKI